MTPLKARHKRFCRWFVELADAVDLPARGELRRTGLAETGFAPGPIC